MDLSASTYWVHLEVDELSSSESDNHLSLVDSALHKGLLAGRLPFIHTLVRPDVTNTIWINLEPIYSMVINQMSVYTQCIKCKKVI